jgi:hypothetical protein
MFTVHQGQLHGGLLNENNKTSAVNYQTNLHQSNGTNMTDEMLKNTFHNVRQSE